MKILTMKEIRKERQKANVKILNFWYKHEKHLSEKTKAIFRFLYIE